MTNRRAVLFDLDGTLHHREPSIARYASRLHERFSIDEEEAAFIDRVLTWDNQGRGRTTEGLFDRIARHFHLDVAGETIAADFRATAWLEPVLFPNAIECLSALSARGFLLGVITNGASETQWHKLRRSGLAERVDAVTVSGDLGIKKPDVAIFAHTLDERGAEAAQAIMVGDHPGQDIVAAKNVGLRTIWTPRGLWDADERYAADAEVRDLAEIPDIASLWLPLSPTSRDT